MVRDQNPFFFSWTLAVIVLTKYPLWREDGVFSYDTLLLYEVYISYIVQHVIEKLFPLHIHKSTLRPGCTEMIMPMLLTDPTENTASHNLSTVAFITVATVMCLLCRELATDVPSDSATRALSFHVTILYKTRNSHSFYRLCNYMDPFAFSYPPHNVFLLSLRLTSPESFVWLNRFRRAVTLCWTKHKIRPLCRAFLYPDTDS